MSAPIMPELGEVTEFTVGEFTLHGINGKLTMNRSAYEDYKYALHDRHSKGRYQIEEAAILIGKKASERADEMLRKLVQAVRDGVLPVYALGKLARYKCDKVRDYFEEAYANDLNTWLEENERRIAWRFPDPQCTGESGMMEGTEARNAKLVNRLEELKKNKCKSPTKTVAEEFHISDSRVRHILRTNSEKKAAQTAPSIGKELISASKKTQ